MKIFIWITLFFSPVFVIAQEQAQIQTQENLKIVAMASVVNGFKSSNSITIPGSELNQFTSLNQRIEWLKNKLDNASVGIVTRDGITWQIVSEFNSAKNIEVQTTVMINRPVFFWSKPVKPYTVVKELTMDPMLMNQSLVSISKYYEGEVTSISYDGIVFINNQVQFISFN